jgi:hypothetical protein
MRVAKSLTDTAIADPTLPTVTLEDLDNLEALVPKAHFPRAADMVVATRLHGVVGPDVIPVPFLLAIRAPSRGATSLTRSTELRVAVVAVGSERRAFQCSPTSRLPPNPGNPNGLLAGRAVERLSTVADPLDFDLALDAPESTWLSRLRLTKYSLLGGSLSPDAGNAA